ncbi:hypothetical protein SDJN02_23433 [Cucurbita argyrosperma subsp. argyrosperma]|nr:hypothetical protein SDJN02_23433 [Cucurbita argyrosperma subsp. argyrosperma]
MDTEIGLFWKAKIEKLYEELGQMEVVFFSPEDEAKFEQGFRDLKLSERAARKEARRRMYGSSTQRDQIEEGEADRGGSSEEVAGSEGGSHGGDGPQQWVANA